MRQVIAIGGGGFGRTQDSNLIEQFILDQASKKNPKICFIPTATGDLDPYIVNYYCVFSKLNCEPTHISFFKRTIDLEEHILKQDVIFVGGGNGSGLTDSWASELKMMKCLNFIPGNCAPHYDEEPERRPATKKFLQDQTVSSMYAIEGGAALHFIDEQPRSTIRFIRNKNAYKVTLKSNKLDENPYEVVKLEQ